MCPRGRLPGRLRKVFVVWVSVEDILSRLIGLAAQQRLGLEQAIGARLARVQFDRAGANLTETGSLSRSVMDQ